MASSRFTVLTGHLSQYSLADLIGILRHQRKTGRLLIEYTGSPAIFFFKDGNLVDAQYNTLIGVQAIFVAFVQPPAAFNFNPLIQPTRDSIDFEQQRVILELLGCWTDDTAPLKSITPREVISTPNIQASKLKTVDAQLLLPRAPAPRSNALPEAETLLALPAGPKKRSLSLGSIRRSWILAFATFVLLLVFGVPTLIAINNSARKTSATPATLQLQGTTTDDPSPAVNASDSELAPAVAGEDKNNSALEEKREHDPGEKHTTEAEQLSAKTRPTLAQNESAATSAPPKSSAQPNATSPDPPQVAKISQPSQSGQTVKVVMRIENGRVIEATVDDRRPGAEAYEALALRIARQRRYPAGVNKQETFVMKVDGPK